MLTADLVRVADVKGLIVPRYLNLDSPSAAKRHLERAEALIDLYQEHIGERRGTLDEAIADLVGDDTNFLVTRGLSKLLADRSTFDTTSPLDPVHMRDVVFTLAAGAFPVVETTDAVHTTSRDDLLQQACDRLNQDLDAAHADALAEHAKLVEEAAAKRAKNPRSRPRVPDPPTPPAPLTPARLEDLLYADHDDQQRLTEFKPIAPLALLHRYNLALAQAVLYRASRLKLILHHASPARYRQLFRYLKFFRLMHTPSRRANGGWELEIDGPLSLFQSTQRYGLQMALFLPALILSDAWEMEADLVWGTERKERTFKLDSNTCTLRSHYRNTGVYVTEEQSYFEDRFNELGTDWELSRDAELIDLGGQDVLVPDLVFRHKHDGRVALMELVGFWRRGWLERRASVLAQHGPPNLIVAISDRMRTDKKKGAAALDLDSKVHIYTFKGVILHRRILKLVEEVAIAPSTPSSPTSKRGRRKRSA